MLCVLSLALLAGAGTSLPSAQCQTHKLVPAAAPLGQAGQAIAFDGNIAVLGAPFDDEIGHWTGAAFVFERQGDVWSQVAKLHASDAAVDDRFGFSVSVDQGVIVAGSRYKQDQGYGTGAVYVFEEVAGVWTETQKLLASDAKVDQFFGNAVSIFGDVILIGAHLDPEFGFASGAAYVFERIGGAWTETKRLTASDGALDDRFGWAVAASSDVLLVGAHGCDISGPQSGAAYVFERSGGTWIEKQKLIPSDGETGERFAYSLDLDGDWAIIGCPFDDTSGPGSGAAYFWKRNAGLWTQAQKITASDGVQDDLFGEQVAIDGSLALAAAWAVDVPGTDAGALYLLQNTGSSWSEQAKLVPSDGAAYDAFAKTVAISGQTILAAAPGSDDLGTDVGAAYVWSALGGSCPDLYAEPATLPIATGGEQRFTLKAGNVFGNCFYFLLGSISGTSPGFSYDGLVLPLNYDAYFRQTLIKPNMPPLTSSFAVLDSQGDASATFTLPGGTILPSFAGLKVNHAYGVFHPITLQLVYTSKPVPLTLL